MDYNFKDALKSYIRDGCSANELTERGIIFGYIKEERTQAANGTNSPLYHFFLEDDEWWGYKFSIDEFWINDVLTVLYKTKGF